MAKHPLRFGGRPWDNGWSSMQAPEQGKRLPLLKCQMEGSAETWVQSLTHEDIATEGKFKQALFKRFKGHESTTSELLDFHQSPRELTDDYLSRVERLSVGSHMPDDVITNIAMKGLKKPIQAQVIGKEPEDLALLRAATQLAKKQMICLGESANTNEVSKLAGEFRELCTLLGTQTKDLVAAVQTQGMRPSQNQQQRKPYQAYPGQSLHQQPFQQQQFLQQPFQQQPHPFQQQQQPFNQQPFQQQHLQQRQHYIPQPQQPQPYRQQLPCPGRACTCQTRARCPAKIANVHGVGNGGM